MSHIKTWARESGFSATVHDDDLIYLLPGPRSRGSRFVSEMDARITASRFAREIDLTVEPAKPPPPTPPTRPGGTPLKVAV